MRCAASKAAAASTMHSCRVRSLSEDCAAAIDSVLAASDALCALLPAQQRGEESAVAAVSLRD